MMETVRSPYGWVGLATPGTLAGAVTDVCTDVMPAWGRMEAGNS